MKVFVATSMIGTFAFEEKGKKPGKAKIVHYVLFQPKPELIAERLREVKRGDLIPEEESLLKDLISSGYRQVIWDKKVDFPGIKCLYEPDNPAKHALQLEFRRLALDLGFAQSQSELNQLLSSVNILLTKQELRKPKKDRMLMSAIGVVDELDRVINTLSERMREWYGLHFPEADKLIQSHEQLARMIHEEGGREKVKDKRLQKYSKVSAGMPFSDDDMSAVREYARSVSDLYRTRGRIADYIRKESGSVIPNLAAIAGPLIASRLVAHAGGLERLAKMSSSTIQLLGAEKALFRHLRGHGKAPKFGVIFAHPNVQKAPKNEKGKAARLLASKLTMAARADFYTGKDISAKLLADLKGKMKAKRRSAGKQKSGGKTSK
jgi:nucleolar protein 56